MEEVRIQEADFDPAIEYNSLRNSGSGTGAIATFTGLVRDSGDLQGVTGLYLEHYPGMTEQVIRDLIRQARERWDIRRVTVIHRVGTLRLSDQIVFVGVASAHRGDAFAACQFLMDVLKTSAPFWKKELTETGEHWVEQKDSDLAVGGRWEE
ncbi:molybdopterin synthase subunit MoaE [Marinobacter segnicrescens]|uniref:Molybdopterin synthase catalytic subunit n=1 Tax=Marinobacter segnicrescens TaxID=430453 RepID=A0A1H9ZWK3_9GAMM|nr:MULTISPECIES: molybdenum cofactor biosynthesis protein MoaE [Marinobacter]UZD66397.1 molybdenum cofactor biosynthesis protein MoaE [Marinobacter sp. AN1]SES86154.1 molybdopterin synthase subunit MoaE [Marinobacter segnicrescens]